MKVMTINPIVVNRKRVEPKDMYLSFSGDKMTADAVKAFQYYVNYNVGKNTLVVNGIYDTETAKYEKTYGPKFDVLISRYPNVIRDINARISGAPTSKGGPSLELMLNEDKNTISPSPQEIAEKNKQGLTWDKFTNSWKKAEDSGLIDTISGWFGKGRKDTPSTPSGPNVAPVTYSQSQPTGMSKGAKIGLAIGGILLVGGIIYMATRKK